MDNTIASRLLNKLPVVFFTKNNLIDNCLWSYGWDGRLETNPYAENKTFITNIASQQPFNIFIADNIKDNNNYYKVTLEAQLVERPWYSSINDPIQYNFFNYDKYFLNYEIKGLELVEGLNTFSKTDVLITDTDTFLNNDFG
jgi:hypothetical protein